jgi:hypothetical protein
MAAKGTIPVPTPQLIVDWYRDFVPVGDAAQPKPRPDAFRYRDRYEVHDLGATRSADMARVVGDTVSPSPDRRRRRGSVP